MSGFTEAILDPRFDHAPVERPRLVYLLASEQRTGSNLLCALLQQSGVAGFTTEYLHLPSLPSVMDRLGLDDVDAYLDSVMRRRTTPNGVFGFKAHYEQIDAFLRRTRRGLPPGLRIVRMLRDDVVAQAVSLYLASRTGTWLVAGRRTSPEPEVEADYDFEIIRNAVVIIVRQRNAWTRLFQRLGIKPPVVAYEALTADPAGVCRNVIARLGIPLEAAAPLPVATPRKQGTARNEDWTARFRAEAAARGMTLP